MRIPYTNFKNQVAGEIHETDTPEIFDDKKIIVFGVPAAFTPLSTKHIKEYDDKYNAIKELGIDEIYCTSVNDSFVMSAWIKDIGIKNVKTLPDGEGVFAQGMGMLVNKPTQGLGMRSWRYSIFVVNSEIQQSFIEPGINHAGDDNDPLGLSSAENMLKFIKGKNI
tara:strand:+ start:3900 stop:4397 length:498 start_codon:yes stop_codon:yes gene_type:complete